MQLLTIDNLCDLFQLKKSSVYKIAPALEAIQLGRGRRFTQESVRLLQQCAIEEGLWPAVQRLSRERAIPTALTSEATPAATLEMGRSTSAKTGAGSRSSSSKKPRAGSGAFLRLVTTTPGKPR